MLTQKINSAFLFFFWNFKNIKLLHAVNLAIKEYLAAPKLVQSTTHKKSNLASYAPSLENKSENYSYVYYSILCLISFLGLSVPSRKTKVMKNIPQPGQTCYKCASQHHPPKKYPIRKKMSWNPISTIICKGNMKKKFARNCIFHFVAYPY